MILITLCFMPVLVLADEENEEEMNQEQIQNQIMEASTQVEKQPIMNARAGVIYDRTSGTVLWGKQENTRRAMASTTKIMTCLVVLEKANGTDVVEVSKKAAATGGSRLGLKTGDKITVNDLLYGLMLRSGNDAAVALAEFVGGDVAGFAEKMNQKAEELGLKDTHFVTPHGLDQPEHYTTCYELAKITDYALNNKKFAQIVNTKSCNITIAGTPRVIFNTNELLGNLAGVDGVKTGFTNNAGRCLVTSTTRQGHQIICVVLGADTKTIRTKDSIKLIEYVFSNFEYINVETLLQEKFKNWVGNNKEKIEINKAKKVEFQIKLEEISKKEIPVLKNDQKDIKVEVEAITYLEAPVPKNQELGNIEVKVNDKVIASAKMVLQDKIEKKTWQDYFIEMITNYTKQIEQALVQSY